MAKTIELIAPSSAASLERVEEGRLYLKGKGFDTSIPEGLLGGDSPYEANTVKYRLEHLQRAANDDSVIAISMVRGGYSSTKIASEIAKLSNFPQKKFIIGFSDLTALFAALNGKHDWLCIHGPAVTQIPKQVNPKCVDQVLDIIDGKINALSITGLVPLNKAAPASGKLVGGNLCVLQTTIGTAWKVSCRGKILFLEDCNEPGYKVDRMLTHLKQSNMLDGVEAVVLGNFSTSDANEAKNIEYALSAFARTMSCPVYKTEAFGHGYENTPLVIGAQANILVGEEDICLQYSWSKC